MAIVTDYKIGIKREIVNALKPVFGSNYPDPNLAGKIYVGLDYPLEEINFPAILVQYIEGPIRNAGVGHYQLDDQMREYRHFTFTGTLGLNILALNPLDRDMVTSGVIQLLTIGREYPVFKDFFNEVMDADWIALQLLTDEITPAGETVQQAPWSDEQNIYANSYSLPLFGEYMSDAADGGYVMIDQVNIYPYRPDSVIPSGSSDPTPWQ